MLALVAVAALESASRPGARRRRPQRERYAALLAAMLAFAVGAAFDWFWEIAGLGAVFFLAGGALVAARCAQLAAARATTAQASERRFGLAVAGLAVAWIAAIALIGPLLVEREIDASQGAVADGDLGAAVDHADTARSIEPWAASPYVQLGLLAELQGDYATRDRAPHRRRSTARTATGSSTPALASRARGRRRGGGRRPTSSGPRQLNPLSRLPAMDRAADERRMAQDDRRPATGDPAPSAAIRAGRRAGASRDAGSA